jgi:hypothetical protein
MDREGHVNGTAVAIVPALLQIPVGWSRHPTPAVLLQRVVHAATALHSIEGELAHKLLHTRGTHGFANVRVPCDVRRVGVQSAPWLPYDIQSLNISTSPGLVKVLCYLLDESKKLRLRLAPVLCDVNIYWRIARIMYSMSYAEADTMYALKGHPMIFGVWHCYVHCVRRVWTVFRPWWMAVEFPELLGDAPETAKCYDYPALIQLEHTVTALAITGPALGNDITRALDSVKAEPDSRFRSHRIMLLEMLNLFLTQYIPCLMHLGVEVRHNYWRGRDRYSGQLVKPLLGKFIIVLSKLSWDTPAAFEYTRSACLAYLAWSEVHDEIPACFHVEECLEASLSRLAGIAHHTHHLEQAVDLAMLYCSSCRSSAQVKNLDKPGFSETFVDVIRKRLPDVLDACRKGTLPFVPAKTPGHRSAGQPWPAMPVTIPLSLMVTAGLDYKMLLWRSLKLLLSAMPASSRAQDMAWNLETDLCAGLTPVGAQTRRLHAHTLQSVTELLKTREQAPKKKAKSAPPLSRPRPQRSLIIRSHCSTTW